MLEVTRATEWRAGRNLRGDAVGAGWMYVLPDGGAGEIAMLGAPPTTSLAALAHTAAHVHVYEPDAARRTAIAAVAASNSARITVHPHCTPGRQAAIAVRARSFAAGAADLDWLVRACRPDGVVWFPVADEAAEAVAAAAARTGLRFALGANPATREIAWAVPGADRALVAGARERAAAPPAGARRWWARTRARRAATVPASAWLFGDGIDAGPPRWLQEIARRQGMDLGGWRWRLWARGEYASQKAILELFDPTAPTATRPAMMVKMPRSPAFGARLENETRALGSLARRGLEAWGPGLRFAGTHGAWYALGTEAIDGVTFESCCRGTADDPRLQQAFESWIRLGERTRTETSAAAVGTVLLELLECYRDLAAPPPDVHRRLSAAFTTLARSRDTLPLVVQHGDAGTWNAMIAADGRLVWLDWEAFEERGLPLWDLWTTARACAVRIAPSFWPRRRRARFARHFFERSPLGDAFAAATRRYCDRVGVRAEHLVPLFYGCWMHRALKEATRLPAGARGHSARLLEDCVTHRTSPGLVALLAQPRTNGATPSEVAP